MQFGRHLSEILPNFVQKIDKNFLVKIALFKKSKLRKPKEKAQKSVKKSGLSTVDF